MIFHNARMNSLRYRFEHATETLFLAPSYAASQSMTVCASERDREKHIISEIDAAEWELHFRMSSFDACMRFSWHFPVKETKPYRAYGKMHRHCSLRVYCRSVCI